MDHKGAAEVLALIEEAGVVHRTIEHEAVYTVEQARATRGELPGAHVKNLFLRDKKKRMWLVTMLADRRIPLKPLAVAIGARSVSFGSEERLWRYLGLRPGSVTPLAVINDREGDVKLVVDRAVLDAELVNVHPLTNTMTTALAPADLLALVEQWGHPADFGGVRGRRARPRALTAGDDGPAAAESPGADARPRQAPTEEGTAPRRRT